MLEKYLNSLARLQGFPDSPLRTSLESFAQDRCDARYARRSLGATENAWIRARPEAASRTLLGHR